MRACYWDSWPDGSSDNGTTELPQIGVKVDYYKILSVARNASQADIQKSYRELALKYHPDANPGNSEAAEKFKEINKAYQTLRSPEKRKEYDATLGGGASKPKSAAPTSPRPAGSTPPVSTGNPLADILGNMMNATRTNAGAESTGDSTADKQSGIPMIEIKLSSREALAGAIKTIKVNGRPLRIKISIVR